MLKSGEKGSDTIDQQAYCARGKGEIEEGRRKEKCEEKKEYSEIEEWSHSLYFAFFLAHMEIDKIGSILIKEIPYLNENETKINKESIIKVFYLSLFQTKPAV